MEYINIGKIVNAQATKGEVRVVPLTDFPERFFKMKEALVNNKGKLTTYHIERAWEHKTFIILKFAEVTDMNGALALKNTFIQIPESQLMKLAPNNYYIHQLEGLQVYTEDGLLLGKLQEVISTGANDVWVVGNQEGKEILLPAIKQVIKQVDIAVGRVVVVLPEGL